jgi:bacterioferritin-associated ferredoxin
MYICICNSVTDSEIRKAVQDGADSFAELSFRTGCGTQCGGCVAEARRILAESRRADDGNASGFPLDLVVTAA